MTSQFVSAAELMARVLGAGGYGIEVIDHPISSASRDELAARARAAALACSRILVGPVRG